MTDKRLVRLNTGKYAPRLTVNLIGVTMRRLTAPHGGDAIDTRAPADHLRDALVIYELAMAARDARHVMFGDTGQRAKDLGLITHLNADGTAVLHETIRDILVAATVLTTDPRDVSLRNPVEEQ